MTNSQLRGRLAEAASSLRRRVDRREVVWVVVTTVVLLVAGRVLFALSSSTGGAVATLLELPHVLTRVGLVPFVVWVALAVLVAWRWWDAPASRRAWLYVAAAAVARVGVELTAGSGVTSGLRAGFSLYTLPTVVFLALPFAGTVGLASVVVLAARSGGGGGGGDESAGGGGRPADLAHGDDPATPTGPTTPTGPAAPTDPATPTDSTAPTGRTAPAASPGRSVAHRVAVIVESLALAAGILLVLSTAGQWFSAEFSLFGDAPTVSDETAAAWFRTLVACLACLVVAFVAAIIARHRGVAVSAVVVAGLVVVGAVVAPVPGDRWDPPGPRVEPLPANYTPCFSGSGKCN